MVDVRRIVVIFVIAILFTIFIQATIDAIYPPPNYSDFCRNQFGPKAVSYTLDTKNMNCTEIREPSLAEQKDCENIGGIIEYNYNRSCPTDYICNTCNKELNDSQEFYNMIVFIISSITGLIALVIGLYLPIKNELNEWIGSGFMLGGLFTLLVGTVRYFKQMNRFFRPAVLLIELLIIIFIAYRKLKKK